MIQPVCLVYNISYVIYHSIRHFGTVSLASVLICPCIQHHGFCSSWSTTYHLSPMSSLLLEYLHVLGSMPTLHLQKKVTFKFLNLPRRVLSESEKEGAMCKLLQGQKVLIAWPTFDVF